MYKRQELTDALQYAVDNNWLKVSPIKEVDPCVANSPVLFTEFITDWLKMMNSRVEITTSTSYERAIVHKIVPYFEPLHYTCLLYTSLARSLMPADRGAA